MAEGNETQAVPSSDMAAFRKAFNKAKHIVILTGAGVSAESGVPTFRGAGGLWRTFRTQAHKAIADCEKRLKRQGRRVVVITQNIDELHRRAGSKNILELHGTQPKLHETCSQQCGQITKNYDRPICKALGGKGAPDPDAIDARIPVEQLPRCKKRDCRAMVRPHVVWFGENLDEALVDSAEREVLQCDLCLVVGTSSIVTPAATFAPMAASRGVPVAEFNVEKTGETKHFRFHFQGPCGTTVPQALAPTTSEKVFRR